MRARCPPGITGGRRGRSAVADEGKHQGGTSQAIFALTQAIVGVLGTVLTALVGAGTRSRGSGVKHFGPLWPTSLLECRPQIDCGDENSVVDLKA